MNFIDVTNGVTDFSIGLIASTAPVHKGTDKNSINSSSGSGNNKKKPEVNRNISINWTFRLAGTHTHSPKSKRSRNSHTRRTPFSLLAVIIIVALQIPNCIVPFITHFAFIVTNETKHNKPSERRMKSAQLTFPVSFFSSLLSLVSFQSSSSSCVVCCYYCSFGPFRLHLSNWMSVWHVRARWSIVCTVE